MALDQSLGDIIRAGLWSNKMRHVDKAFKALDTLEDELHDLKEEVRWLRIMFETEENYSHLEEDFQ